MFMVLVGIILFAALSITALEGSQNSADLKNEEVKLAATELIDYSRNMIAGYRRMRTLNNCMPEQINLDKLGAQNPNAPDDGSCNLFDPKGGKVVHRPYAPSSAHGDIAFFGHGPLCTDGSCTELYHVNRIAYPSSGSFTLDTAERICKEINYQLFDYDDIKQTKDITRVNWNGSFLYTTSFSSPDYHGQRVFCTKETSTIVTVVTILEVR